MAYPLKHWKWLRKLLDFVYDLKFLVIHRLCVMDKDADFMFVIFHNKKNKECVKTFKETCDDISSIGTFLFKRGLRDCKIALLGENGYEWVVVFFAVLLGKNVFVPLDRDLPAEDLAEQLILSGCSVLFYSEKFKEKAEAFQSAAEMPVEHYFSIKDFDAY